MRHIKGNAFEIHRKARIYKNEKQGNFFFIFDNKKFLKLKITMKFSKKYHSQEKHSRDSACLKLHPLVVFQGQSLLFYPFN